jgi:hypothetical protein
MGITYLDSKLRYIHSEAILSLCGVPAHISHLSRFEDSSEINASNYSDALQGKSHWLLGQNLVR